MGLGILGWNQILARKTHVIETLHGVWGPLLHLKSHYLGNQLVKLWTDRIQLLIEQLNGQHNHQNA